VQERPLKLRERHPVALVHVPSTLLAVATVAYLEIGVLHGQWRNGAAYGAAIVVGLVSELVLSSGTRLMESFFEWYARQRPFTGLQLGARRSSKRQRSHDR
jgi:hypothetical protein